MLEDIAAVRASHRATHGTNDRIPKISRSDYILKPPKVCLDETEYILDRSEMRRVGRTSERHVPSLPNRLQRQRRHVLSQVVEEEHAIWSANWKKSRIQVLNPTIIVHIVGAELYSKVAHAIDAQDHRNLRVRRVLVVLVLDRGLA